MTTKQHPSLELRIYRFISIVLLSILTSIAAYLAQATVNASNELPAIKQQLAILNNNLERLQDLPVKVEALTIKQDQVERRLTRVEDRRAGS